jgi:NitT/TauT family transport system substrate-binding protein
MPVELRYGQVQRSAMNWPFFAASELELFAAEGIAVKTNVFTSPPDPVNLLVSGSVDVINVIPDVALLEMANGAPLCVIANTNVRSQYRLMVKPEIADVAGLKGKRLGVNDGRSAEALILRKLLKQGGLAADAYEVVSSGPPPERCEKLKWGVLDGTMVTEPFHFLLREAGFKILGSSLAVVPHYPFTVCLVRREETISESVVAFLKTLRAAWVWLNDPANREQAVAILSRCTGSAPQQAELTYELYFNPPSAPSLTPTPKGIATVFELLAESGRLSSIPNSEQFIDYRYVQKLAER